MFFDHVTIGFMPFCDCLLILGCQAEIIVAGGMESMTNIPYYITKARFGGYKYISPPQQHQTHVFFW